MPLTNEDLGNIQSIVEATIESSVEAHFESSVEAIVIRIVQGAVGTSEARLMRELSKKADKADLDRMESRLVTSINLLERDTFSRLDQHEVRLTRLEQAQAQ